MCSPNLSFMINPSKKIFYKDGINSHSVLANKFNVDEDKLIKVDYDWTTRSIDIYGENEAQNETAPFELKASHYKAIDNFIQKKVGTKDKLINWLKKNTKDKKVMGETVELLDTEGKKEYNKLLTLQGKKFNLKLLLSYFKEYPNLVWGGVD